MQRASAAFGIRWSLWSYLVILVVTLVGWVATFKMFSSYRKRIAFWI